MVLFWILVSTFLVSLISLVGIFTLAIKDILLHKVLFCLIGFSAGALIGSAFLHILPEALEKTNSINVFYYLILGIILFFLMERYLHWRHCHDKDCHIHAFTYLNLFGEAFHNFIDGLAIAASFVISIKLGIVTTLAIIMHEIPKELGTFGVLIYGGFSRKKALFYNFISALMAIKCSPLRDDNCFVYHSLASFSSYLSNCSGVKLAFSALTLSSTPKTSFVACS